ncbi:MAG: phage holin family protein [Bacteroidetes bacterium]|nr:phage holin family protein [Bacteroidota bacterium]
MNFIIQLIVSALAVLISSYILPGVEVDNIVTALLVAAVLAFLNTVIKPIMVLLTIPVTVLSFGLFLLVINAFIIILTDKLIDGFQVRGFWWALLFSLVLSFVTSVLNSLQARSETNE